MNKIKTFEDACKALNLNPESLPVVSALPEKHQKAIAAHYKLVIIAQALNEGWEPNWDDYSQYKYYPWFFMSGSGFSRSRTDFGCTGAGVGSRLCFGTRELARYAGTQFEELYKDYFLIG